MRNIAQYLVLKGLNKFNIAVPAPKLDIAKPYGFEFVEFNPLPFSPVYYWIISPLMDIRWVWLTASLLFSSSRVGILRSLWISELRTNQEAFAILRNGLFFKVWMDLISQSQSQNWISQRHLDYLPTPVCGEFYENILANVLTRLF